MAAIRCEAYTDPIFTNYNISLEIFSSQRSQEPGSRTAYFCVSTYIQCMTLHDYKNVIFCGFISLCRSSASLYRSRALIQSLSDATKASKVEGPPIPGSAHATPTAPTSSLKSKLELLGPGDGEELMSEGQRQLQQLLRKQLDTTTTFKTYIYIYRKSSNYSAKKNNVRHNV